MSFRGAAVALGAALAFVPAACSGGEGEPEATTVATASTEAPAARTSTGSSDEAPPASTEPAPSAAPGESVDSAVVVEAAAETAAAGSARVATSATVTGPGDVEQSFGGEGAFDFERRAGTMTVRLDPEEGAPFSRATVVFVDSAVYYRLPTGIVPGDKRWLRLDLQSLADATSLDLGPLTEASQADPSQSLLWLQAIRPELERLGEEDVQGTPTTHYRALVDLRLLERHAPAGEEAEWGAYVQRLRARLGAAAIPVEIWVDGDGLIRRLRHEHAFAAEGTSTEVTTELYDFGVQVDVEPPPAGQVAGIDDLIRP